MAGPVRSRVGCAMTDGNGDAGRPSFEAPAPSGRLSALGGRWGGNGRHRRAHEGSGTIKDAHQPASLGIRRATRPGTGLTRGFEPRHSPHGRGPGQSTDQGLSRSPKKHWRARLPGPAPQRGRTGGQDGGDCTPLPPPPRQWALRRWRLALCRSTRPGPGGRFRRLCRRPRRRSPPGRSHGPGVGGVAGGLTGVPGDRLAGVPGGTATTARCWCCSGLNPGSGSRRPCRARCRPAGPRRGWPGRGS